MTAITAQRHSLCTAILFALTLTIIGGGLVAPGPASAAARGPARDGPSEESGQLRSERRPGPVRQIAWHACTLGDDDELGPILDRARVECGDLVVPLDYANPRGRTITVAISRLRASDPDRRLGTLLINTGGPGGRGLEDVLPVREWTGDVGARFDLIGMDPRFVGRSTPLDCGWPVGDWLRGGGPGRADFAQVAAFEADLARRCRRHADVLPYVTTRNTARDLDAVRIALGEQRLSYLGYSYGTYLGSVYAQMFPGRTDRMVLDSAVDPATYGPRLLRRTGAANEAGLRDWARWAAAHHSELHLGSSEQAVLATVDRVRRRAARQPLRVGDFEISAGLVTRLLINPLDDDRDPANNELASTVRVLERAARGLPSEPNTELVDTLRFLLTGAQSHYGSVQSAILCGDVPAPRNPEVYLRDIRAALDTEPRFATVTHNLGPCAFWPTTPRERPTRIANQAPALIVQSTGDTRTTYAGALNLHRALTGSRMITLTKARIHAVFGNYANPCIDGEVKRYLRDGTLPARNLTC